MNAPKEKFHSKVTEVDFIRVKNILSTSLVAKVFEDPHREDKLITNPIWEKHIENSYRKSKSLQINKSNFGVMREVLFIVECYIVLKTKGRDGASLENGQGPMAEKI
jgi:hypothetical protein